MNFETPLLHLVILLRHRSTVSAPSTCTHVPDMAQAAVYSVWHYAFTGKIHEVCSLQMHLTLLHAVHLVCTIATCRAAALSARCS